jgi:hypothetical protein
VSAAAVSGAWMDSASAVVSADRAAALADRVVAGRAAFGGCCASVFTIALVAELSPRSMAMGQCGLGAATECV